MNNIESGISQSNKPESSLLSRGREAVPVEMALEIQNNLIKRMIPLEFASYIEADPNLSNSLILRWVDKYADKFEEYCDLNADNEELMTRMVENNLTNENYSSIQTFLEQSPEGGPFFTAEELQEFIKENTH